MRRRGGEEGGERRGEREEDDVTYGHLCILLAAWTQECCIFDKNNVFVQKR